VEKTRTKPRNIDAVAASGPFAVSELARSIGRRQTALYAHVSALRAEGLLQRVGDRCDRGRPSAIFKVPARPIYYDLTDPKRDFLQSRK
jgi:predicted ArsR family transcriptional regulator